MERLAGRPKPNVCDICGRGGKICFDHSHSDSVFRGWLCNHCNLILGHANDDPELLRKLARYVEGEGWRFT
jgi:recombination endonuclease VII